MYIGFRYVRGCLFADILMIDHLWEFTSLARLDMNNNLIEKIEGLERLGNLKWLSKMKPLYLYPATLSCHKCASFGKYIDKIK